MSRHPGLTVLQCLSAYCGGELASLNALLRRTERLLAPGGLLCVSTCTVMQDRLVKRFLKACARGTVFDQGDFGKRTHVSLSQTRRAAIADAERSADGLDLDESVDNEDGSRKQGSFVLLKTPKGERGVNFEHLDTIRLAVRTTSPPLN
jgi:hypothetical protein